MTTLPMEPDAQDLQDVVGRHHVRVLRRILIAIRRGAVVVHREDMLAVLELLGMCTFQDKVLKDTLVLHHWVAMNLAVPTAIDTCRRISVGTVHIQPLAVGGMPWLQSY